MNYLTKPFFKFSFVCLLVLSCLLPISYANNTATDVRHGLHGMLLFSDGSSLYASHLPMFHRPHDVQLIFRFTLVDKKVQSQLISALGVGKPYWTLSPEKFDLNLLGGEAKNAIKQFSADLFEGHFERDGKLIHKAQMVKVEHVQIKKTLDREQLKTSQFMRITPKSAERQFYARIIAGKPGVDQLFSVISSKVLPERITLHTGQLDISQSQIAKQLGLVSNQVQLYYQEFGDLR